MRSTSAGRQATLAGEFFEIGSTADGLTTGPAGSGRDGTKKSLGMGLRAENAIRGSQLVAIGLRKLVRVVGSSVWGWRSVICCIVASSVRAGLNGHVLCYSAPYRWRRAARGPGVRGYDRGTRMTCSR